MTTISRTTAAPGRAGAALARRGRPPRPSALSASLTFGWRALLKFRHVPEQLIDAIGVPVMFTLLFTYLFGGALAGSPRDYLQFLLPGVLVQTILLTTMYTGVGLNADVTKGVFDRFRSLPVWRPAAIVGALLGDLGRAAIAATLVITVGLALGFRPAGGAGGVLAAALLLVAFTFSMAWAWSALGLAVRSPQAVMGVGWLVLFPFTFASNIFVDPSTIPGWLRAFVDVNPVSHLATTTRALMAGTATATQVGGVLLAAAALVAVFAPLTMRLYRTRQ